MRAAIPEMLAELVPANLEINARAEDLSSLEALVAYYCDSGAELIYYERPGREGASMSF